MSLANEYQAIQTEAIRLAGGLRDLAQRATVYHHLFRASGGNHIFPLIAAHGALWAGGYFKFGRRLGELLAWEFRDRATRRRRLEQLDAFADAFREINRQVCIDTYTSFYFSERFGDDPAAAEFLSPEVRHALNRMHAARREGRELSDRVKREVFIAHFVDEQERIVGPAIERAVAAFDWPLVRWLALRPWIRFAYFPSLRCLWFSNFASREQRIINGLRAFDHAASVGWSAAEAKLRKYEVLPNAFFANPTKYFHDFRTAFLNTAGCS